MNEIVKKSDISEAKIVEDTQISNIPEQMSNGWLAKIIYAVFFVVFIGNIVCFYFCAKENYSNASDSLFQYSHEIHINTNVKKTSLENWHQALIDSVYSSTHWNSRYFHPEVTVNIDSVHVSYPVELDSLTLCLSKIDRLYKEYYNDALNDLRQESNNIINKWSAWLGFWISILALLMGLLPIAIQFKLSSRSEKRVKAELERLEKFYQEKEDEQKRVYQKLEQDLRNNLLELKMGRHKTKVINAINAIDLGKNNKLLIDSPERERLLRTLMIDLRKQFCEFIKANKEADICNQEDKYSDLIIVLIEMHGVVTKLIPLFQSKKNSRKISDLQSQLQSLLLEIAHNYSSINFDKIEEIQEKFNRFVDEFK